MALIKCPECGQEVSDKATDCPRCGYPIAQMSPSGTVRVKLSRRKGGDGFGVAGKNQPVIITSSGKTLWEGNSGEIAEFFVDGPIKVEVKYKMTAMEYGGTCEGTIDPSKGKKYCVSVQHGAFKSVLSFQMVDVIDAD